MNELDPNVPHGGESELPDVDMNNTPTHVYTFADTDGGSITLVDWGLGEAFTTNATDVFDIVHA